MYIVAQFGVTHFEQTRGNPHCRYMDWNMDNTYDREGNVTGYKREGNGDEEAEQWFVRWKEGRTGFPWIDALMRQLKHDGWIHQYSLLSAALTQPWSTFSCVLPNKRTMLYLVGTWR